MEVAHEGRDEAGAGPGARDGRRPGEGVLRREGAGSTPTRTTPSATRCGSCSSRLPGRRARSRSARASPRWSPVRSRACSWSSPTSRRPGPTLAGGGVEVSEVQDFPWGRFVFFADPDGNGWAVQQLAEAAGLSESRSLPRARRFGKLSRVIHDAQGFWLSQEERPEANAVLDGEVTADVVVLGGGFSGMWTAWLIREAEPNARVVLLGGRHVRPRPLGAERRLCELDVVRPRLDAGILRRRGHARPRPGGGVGDRRDRRVVLLTGGGRVLSPWRLSPSLDGKGARQGLGARGRRLLRPRRGRGGGGAVGGQGAGALRVADLSRRRVLSSFGHGQPGAARARAKASADRDRGGGFRALESPRAQGRAGWRRGANGRRRRSGGPRCPRNRRRAGGCRPAPAAPDAHLEPHGHHRASARRHRGARLDGRGVHH